jgi:glycine cleavage system transcriptional repressor
MADTFFALSALGPDKQGLVAALTRYIAERRGNVEESRMAILGAEFGILMLVRAPEDAAQKLKQDVGKLEAETGLLLRLVPTKSPSEHRQAAMPYRLIADAADNEGIISKITETCARHGINVVALESESYPAPVTATPLFRMNALIDVPQTVKVGELRAALTTLAAQAGIDLELKAER